MFRLFGLLDTNAYSRTAENAINLKLVSETFPTISVSQIKNRKFGTVIR